MALMKDELTRAAEKYGDDRRTEITSDEGEFTDRGPDRRRGHGGHHLALRLHQADVGVDVPATAARRKGGHGGDAEGRGFRRASVHRLDARLLLVFTDDGRCFWLKVHEIPQAGRAAKGKPIVNMINVSPDTRIQAMMPVREFPDEQVPALRHPEGHGEEDGAVAVPEPAHHRHQGDQDRGWRRADRRAGDDGNNDIVLATRHGLSIRFHESDVRAMGRDTTGVKGIELGDGDDRGGHGRDQARGHPAGASPSAGWASARQSMSTECRSAVARASSR